MRPAPRALDLAFGVFLSTASLQGCVTARIQVVDERTALENQILGAYEELDRDLQLVASVRASRKGTKTLSELRAQAIRARQMQQFNLDDVTELKEQGCLGETNQNELVARPCPEESNAAIRTRRDKIAREENAAREAVLKFIVGTSPNLTEADLEPLKRAWARLNREQAPSGHWVQTEAGEWRR